MDSLGGNAMRKWIVLGAVAVVVSSIAYQASLAGADAEMPTIKDVMNKLHKGAKSPLAQLKGELASASPDWPKIQKETKDFVILGASLAKNDPPKGDKGSWKTLADGYFADAKALDDAANAKDLASAQAAHKKLATSCKSCHGAHKGK
jgi:mono/diheme cytochrome c family protein